MQLFPKAANAITRAILIGAVVAICVVGMVFNYLYKGPYVTQKRVPREQPVPFSHQHHVSGLGIDCRYCHTSVDQSSFAGIPPVHTCMTCHSQIWASAPILEPVRESFRTGRPLRWRRVNTLPDYVYFNHGIHIAKGIGCTTCHGPVGDMPLTWQDASLHMRWCLSCHRNPEQFVRPKDQVFNAHYRVPPPREQERLGRLLVQRYHIQSRTDCYTCHR